MPNNVALNNEEESLPILNITTINSNTITAKTTAAATTTLQRKIFEPAHVTSNDNNSGTSNEQLVKISEIKTTTTDANDCCDTNSNDNNNISHTTLYPTVIESSTSVVLASIDAQEESTVKKHARLKCKTKNSSHNSNNNNVTSPTKTVAYTKEQSARLATLRVRRSPSEQCLSSCKTKQSPNKEPIKDLQTNLASDAAAAVAAAKAFAEHFDVALLNKIEPYECQLKKLNSSGSNSTKRKRVNSGSIATTAAATSHARKKVAGESQITPQQAAYIKDNNIADIFENSNNNGTTVILSRKRAAARTHNSNSNSNNNNNNSNNKSNNNNSNSVMSLYEHRYQNDDARASSSGGSVSNGYLNTTTRAAGANTHTLSSATDATESQDNTNQYYITAPNASAVPSSNIVAGSVSSSTTTIGTLSNGSNSVITHAPSMATLCNIGNTCYLNSVVYTLRFAPHFLHNLHHLVVELNSIQQSILRQRAKSSSLGRGMSSAHMESAAGRSWSSKDLASMDQYTNTTPLTASSAVLTGSDVSGNLAQKSTHQLLTERLHDLYQSLHRNEVNESTEPFHADTLLHAIQDVSAIFEGNQQQDAHEFLMCLLNSIRETSQTLIKTIAEYPDFVLNANTDEVDQACYAALDGSVSSPPHNSHMASPPHSSTTTSSSSLSTSNITKNLFFSRKSKRKEESKSAKNSRLQSPLKDGGTQQPQQTSNSLFYLNTVDLSGSGSSSANVVSNSTAVPVKTATFLVGGGGGGAGDDDAVPSATPSNVLKDKERLAEKIRELGLDFFREDFEGVTVSTTKCLSCETVTEQKESMIDIAVPVPISGYDSADYTEKPSAFIQNSCITREYFRNENKYRCEKCTGYTEAIRSISYEVLPRLLVIQLSRFSGGMEKINSYIPTSFTLQCFCSKCCILSDANKLHIYKLYSVITHVGATMSVGHYIAYTCALDWGNEYVNCAKDRRHMSQQQLQSLSAANSMGSSAFVGTQTTSSAATTTSSAASAAASAIATSGTNLIKKMKFGRSKASSSGDMSKNVKNLNGIMTTSKAITNGIGKLSMNTTCHSLNCCATHLCNTQSKNFAPTTATAASNNNNNSSDLSEEALQNGANHSASNMGYNYLSGYGSTGRSGSKTAYGNASAGAGIGVGVGAGTAATEPIWYMCDDDKIKAMTQREFEELLSPSRKITITPYLLFYARFDLQPTAAAAASATTSTSTLQQPTPPPKQSAPAQSAWSNESNSLHKI